MTDGLRLLPDRCFVSCDWGTTHFRLRIVRAATGIAIAEVHSDEGVARLAAGCGEKDRPAVFRSTLERSLAALADRAETWNDRWPVVISGMASSSIGWQELPYSLLPLALDASNLQWRELEPATVHGHSHRVFLLSGARGDWEIMRGEETQVLGLMQLQGGAFLANESVVILPGTHSKHLYVAAGYLDHFKTFMTGELFQLLKEHSVLRHSVGSHGTIPPSLSDLTWQAFESGARSGAVEPLTEWLFRVRTRQVLYGHGPAENEAFLSGLLIGAEFGALARHCPASLPVILCGGEHLTERYERALRVVKCGGSLRIVSAREAQTLTARGQSVFLNRILAARD